MRNINKKIIISFLVVLELWTIFLLSKSFNNKNIMEDDSQTNREKLAIKIDNGNGDYVYASDFPGKGYALNKNLTECIDTEGNKVTNPKITSDGESVTVTSKYTNYCTLYFYLPENREYEYTGDYQVFIAPKTGEYKIELWGASGGEYHTSDDTVGRGAYTKGSIHLNKNEKLYIYVGENSNINGANLTILPFNGGGPGESSGGGATDVRLSISEDGSWDDFDSLKSRIMVAAGGGGGAYYQEINISKGYVRGDGGTLNGIDAKFDYNNTNNYSGHGGTQTGGGEPGSIFSGDVDPKKITEMTGKFGSGGYGLESRGLYTYTSSGGGGGYYGGGHGNHPGNSWTGGGGGSSFISGYTGCVAIDKDSTENHIIPLDTPNHYSGKIFTDTEMIAGNSQMPTHDGSGKMTGNTGNGYAKITFVK